MLSNRDRELLPSISQDKVNRWLRETRPASSGNDFPPDVRSEDRVRNTTRSPARGRAQQRTSRHHRPDASPDRQHESSRRKRRRRDESQLSSDSSDQERRPRREQRPTGGFDPAHHDEQRREGRGYAHETERHRSLKEKRRRPEHSPPTPDDRFEKAARHKTREDRYDTHREADQKRRHSAKQKGNSASRGHHLSQFRRPSNVMANFKSDRILTDHITLKPPDPDEVGRRPVNLDSFEAVPETAQKNALSASRARRRRREDRESEQVTAFFREARLGLRGHRIGTTAPASNASSRESPYLSRSELLQRHERLRQESETPPPKLSAPSGGSKQHVGQSPAVTYRDQGVTIDHGLKAKSPPPLQSSLPARASGNNLDKEAPLQARSQETTRPPMPVEQQHLEPPARPISPKWRFNLAERLQECVDNPEFSLPVGADEYLGYDEASTRGGLRGYSPMTPVSEQQKYPRSLSQVNEHGSHHLAAEPELIRPRPPSIPVPLQAPQHLFSGMNTGFYGSRASELGQFESTARPSSLLEAPAVSSPTYLQHSNDATLSWRFRPSTTQRPDKREAMARFILDNERAVYGRDASDYGLEPAAYNGPVQTDTNSPREVEVREWGASAFGSSSM
ncbi:hypothetical protein MAPG_06495 [Magnaporthiopsis poae ATCC 64411]|uniref:Uncharacterized protein n=1 Tax=Magnaporthiopsis poae (strain ATCC 64411 / 73-15) TaxID=644358 RepID=A0A0C4E266_MAGP6|nr:hypothetical protein MAPG_06495 [Magnaporthiopsis poae ATCC 64411]